jgi:bifunctional non-homologous end joining protein LigD
MAAVPAGLGPPMLATLGPLPRGPGWATEFKWDGVRTVAYLGGAAPILVSRNNLDVTGQYPEVAELGRLAAGRQLILDGEIVALDPQGVPRFALLQNRMHVAAPTAALLRSIPVTYYLFDLLALDGAPTVALPYARRRELLDALALDAAPVRTPPAFPDADPAQVYRAALDNGLEGVVCKRTGSTYQPGRRSPDWVKVPVTLTQEVLVIGWQDGAGRRTGMIGALLLAVHDADGTLVYVGKVGTGFTDRALRELAADLRPLARPEGAAPDVPRADARGAHWVQPSLVGEVAFRTWTPDARLRHPSWRGLRPDRRPDEVRLPATVARSRHVDQKDARR